MANGGKPVIDQEESIRMAGLSDYPDETITRLKDEANTRVASGMQGQEEEITAALKAS